MSNEISNNESGGTVGSIVLRRGYTILVVWLITLPLLLLSPKARAQGSLRYSVVDLVDTTPGQDLWEYTYFLTGSTFQTNQGFSIFFNYQTFANLTNARPSLNPAWNVLAVQPDVLLNADGYLDGLALVNSPSYAGPFQVVVTWKGQGTPGAQPFSFYNSNPFSTTFSGNTTSVPEPRSILLTGLGLLLLLRGRSWRKARPIP